LTGDAFFSEDYGTARDRFREAVSRLGFAVESHVIAAPGPRGEALSIDAASLGPPQCRRVLILSSGLHGVEGFFGSALQLAWLARFASAVVLPKDVKVVVVHALNPFGFAWLRRCNENNVDLNRNFLRDRTFIAGPQYRESQEAYNRLCSFLNPARPPSSLEPYAFKAAWHVLAAGRSARKRLPPGQRPSLFAFKAISQLGLAELQRTLVVGQYHCQNGLFYGGDGPEESTAWLKERLPVWVSGAELTLHLDFHTGLGQWADGKLLIADRKTSPRAQWLAEQFGDELVEAAESPVAYIPNGPIARYFRDHHGGGVYHCLTAEFGTYQGIRVLGALRAENQAHFHARPDSPAYQWAKRQVREAFAPAATDWRKTVIAKALAIVARAIDVCRGTAPGPAANRVSSGSPW
jgi:hypothetical protein